MADAAITNEAKKCVVTVSTKAKPSNLGIAKFLKVIQSFI